jgi:hypothetical protein
VEVRSRTGLRTDPVGKVECTDFGDTLLRPGRWQDAVREVSLTAEHRLHAIRVGNPREGHLLSTSTIADFIADVRDAYDFTVFDTSSFPAVSDALVLASMADHVLAVIRLEHTLRGPASDNARQLLATSAEYALILNEARAV